MKNPFLNQLDDYPQGLWMVYFKVCRACVPQAENPRPCQFNTSVDIFCLNPCGAEWTRWGFPNAQFSHIDEKICVECNSHKYMVYRLAPRCILAVDKASH